MPAPVKAAMPDNVDIGQGFVLQVAAMDATNGNTVAGVKLSNMSIEVEQLTTGSLESGVFGPFMFVPGPGA